MAADPTVLCPSALPHMDGARVFAVVGGTVVYAHVGHDCIVGDLVVFANGTQIGGHCEIGDHVFFGALAGVQFAVAGQG